MILSPDIIFHVTGVIVWWAVCISLVVCVIAVAIIVPLILIKRTLHSMWTWVVCAKLKQYDLIQQDVFDAYQDAYNMSDIGKLLTKDEERETVLKFIKIFVSEMESRARKNRELLK